MTPRTLRNGEIVQLNPDTCRNKAFAACLFIVTEAKSFGAMGYVQALGETREEAGGLAYYRANWDEMEPTGGTAVWMPKDDVEGP